MICPKHRSACSQHAYRALFNSSFFDSTPFATLVQRKPRAEHFEKASVESSATDTWFMPHTWLQAAKQYLRMSQKAFSAKAIGCSNQIHEDLPRTHSGQHSHTNVVSAGLSRWRALSRRQSQAIRPAPTDAQYGCQPSIAPCNSGPR